MKLNHINLPVSDVVASSRFFETYFNFKCIENKGDNLISVLEGTDGFTLVLMAPSFNRKGNIVFPDAFHIGFFMDSRAEVTEIYDRLSAAGLASQPPASIRGGYGFYFNAPGDILTEVTTYN
ncbi:VOC family protein [Mucilaginibacter flavus]|uniref:VOC family protein n=1 Tax=Mucilaginibacter flavus TaxID=931504 RepID=UPI0025B5475D|nr:VOC family protein [Mucilaginibacter flavus]MDN3582741.1 VOC family protein [Mucilaginibacter flavus]